MKPKTLTRIYALINNRKVFVGRCTAVKLSAVIYGHCRGEHLQTQKHFDLNKKRPDLYVLEEIEDESHVAYRHWLAWIHTFEAAGYEVLNREDALEDSRDLHPETRQIYEQIQKIPLALQLELAYRSTYTASDYNSKNIGSHQTASPSANSFAATEKLSVRMSKNEKNLIESFAKWMNLTMRDALIYAITNLMCCDDNAMSNEKQMYSIRERHLQDIENLKKQKSDLTEQLKNQHQKHTEKAEKYRKQMDTIQTGIHQYLTYLEPNMTIPLRIEQEKYRNYIYNTDTDYSYPSKEGFAVIRPHAILRGITPQAQFLVGETDYGENIKLRYYPSKHFTGMFPGNERFGLRGSCWLVGWEQKEENVMQLNFALPLSVHPKYDDPMIVGKADGKLMQEINLYN